MIAFGCAVTAPDIYKRFAERGIERVREPDSQVLAIPSVGSLARTYNFVLGQAGARDDLEAFVLLHQDAEIVTDDFCRRIREALADPAVAVVGCAGAIDVRGIAWWEGYVTWAGFAHRYNELGGGQFAALTWNPDEIPEFAHTGEVDSIDGFVMALSPWAVRELRFDESLGRLHGYDLDFCLQARAAGRKVVTFDFRAVHHHSLGLINDAESWVQAHMRVAEKWDGVLPTRGLGDDWRQRARRAEAEASAARTAVLATDRLWEARFAHMERTFKDSLSWRMTAPLRTLRRLRRRVR